MRTVIVVIIEEISAGAEGEAVTVSTTVTKLVPAEILCTDIIVKTIESRDFESDEEKTIDDEEDANDEEFIAGDVETGVEVAEAEVGEETKEGEGVGL